MARVVVIGGGITGTLATLQLAKDGHRVTLLEGAHLGAGSSSRSAAGIRQQFSTAGTVVAMRHSVAFYKAFARDADPGSRAIIQNGYLFLHDEPARWQRAQHTVQLQRDAGLEDAVALDPQAVVQQFPWVDREAIVGATWCASDGFLQPDIIYQQAAQRARELGAEVISAAPVQQARHDTHCINAVKTPKGWFEADLFVDCTNSWSPRTGAIVGGTALQIRALKRYLWFLHREQALSRETLRQFPLVVAPSGAYCRPESTDTLMFGKKYDVESSADFSYDQQDTVDPSFTHNAGIDAVPYEVWMELAALMPELAEFSGVSATTAGYYGTTPDHNPFIGFDPQVPNLIRAVGFSGHGAMMGPFSAAAIGALVAAGRDIPTVHLPQGSVPLDVFRIGRAFDHAETMVI